MTTPVKQRLADQLLPGGFRAYVTAHREAGESWQSISFAIREEIDLYVHPHTLRLWFVEPAQVAS